MKSLILKVEGMHCDGCAETIKALVARELGVKSVAVSFAGSEARILYDPAATSENRLIAVVERPGFRITSRSA